jgi:phosphopantetheinyl transferase
VAVSDQTPVGIDLEPIGAATEATAEMVMTPRERALAPELDATWATTAWTIKEAVGKARGTGLQGRPKDIEIEEVDGAWARVGDLWIQSTQEDGFVISSVRPRG